MNSRRFLCQTSENQHRFRVAHAPLRCILFGPASYYIKDFVYLRGTKFIQTATATEKHVAMHEEFTESEVTAESAYQHPHRVLIHLKTKVRTQKNFNIFRIPCCLSTVFGPT